MADQTLDQLPDAGAALDGDLLYAVREGLDHKTTRAAVVAGLAPASRAVATGAGLKGGGDLTADRTLELDVAALPENTAPVLAADYVLVHETAANAPRRVRLDRLPTAPVGQNTFQNVAVAGQPTIIADGNTDTLNVAAGANVVVTTNSATDTLTIAAPNLVPTSRNVGAGAGLSGGGDLSANRSFAVNIAGQPEDAAPALADHYLLSHDVATGTLRKLRATLLSGGTYVLPAATGSTLGGVRVGSGLAVDVNGLLTLNYTIPAASTVSLGGVKVGANLAVAGDGTISANPPYALPTASAGVLGGVRVGSGLAIDGSGVLSATATGGTDYTLPVATASTLGGVRQGANVSIDGSGVLSVAAPYSLPPASAGTLGGIRLGTGLSIDGSGVVSVVSGGGSYTLPPATSTTLGGVKVGSGIIAAGDGTISVASSGGSPDDGTIRPAGVVKGSVTSAQRTTNRTAIQAAIDAMAAQGYGRVALGGGLIEIDAEITLSGGHGNLRVLDGEGCCLRMHASDVNIIRLAGARHFAVMNMELRYSAQQTTGLVLDWVVNDPKAAIRLRNSMFNKFSNIVIKLHYNGVCADTADQTGVAGGGSYSNHYDHIEINMADNSGVGYQQSKGTGSVINNMYITANGTHAPCVGGIRFFSVGQTTFNQLNVEWIKCKRAIQLSNCYGTVFNSVNIEGITPLPGAGGTACVVHQDSLCTANFTGGVIADIRFDQTANAVSTGVLFSVYGGSKLDVRGMHISAVKKTGTVRTVLVGIDNATSVQTDGFATFSNITLRRAEGSQDHFNLDDLVIHSISETGSTQDGPLREFNNVIGGGSVMKTWQMASGVPSADPSAPTPPPANVLHLARHGSWQRFIGATSSNLTVVLSNLIDVPMRTATQSVPRNPPGATYRITRGASATGTGVLTVANHNGNAITTLSAAQTAEFFYDGANWFLVGKVSAA